MYICVCVYVYVYVVTCICICICICCNLYMYIYCLNVDIKLKILHSKYHSRLSLTSLIMVTSHLENNTPEGFPCDHYGVLSSYQK